MPAPGFTEVQSKSGAGSGTSITVTLTSAPSSSNLVVIEVWANGNVTFTAPTGFTVPSGGSTANAKSSGAVMAATSQTATSYTVTLSASSAHVCWTVREWSGASGLGAASFGYYTASNSAITLDPTLTPQNANSQLIGNFGAVGNPTETINTSGWTNEFSVKSGGSFDLFSDQYGSAAGSASIGESATFSAVTNAGDAAGIYEILPSGGTTYTEIFSITGTGAPTLNNQVGKPFAVSGLGVSGLQNQIGKPFSAEGVGAVSLARSIGKTLSIAGSGIVSAVISRVHLIAASVAGSGAVSLAKRVGKLAFVTGSGSANLVRQIERSFAAVGGGAVSLVRQIARAFSVVGSAIVSGVFHSAILKVTLPTQIIPMEIIPIETLPTQIIPMETLPTQIIPMETLPMVPIPSII